MDIRDTTVSDDNLRLAGWFLLVAARKLKLNGMDQVTVSSSAYSTMTMQIYSSSSVLAPMFRYHYPVIYFAICLFDTHLSLQRSQGNH